MNSFLEALELWQGHHIPELRALVDQRIYPVQAPQGVALPCIVYTQVSDLDDLVHSGRSPWHAMRLQYDAYARSFHEVHDIARALRLAYEGQSFPVANEMAIAHCRVEAEFDVHDADEGIYRRTLEFIFHYTDRRAAVVST